MYGPFLTSKFNQNPLFLVKLKLFCWLVCWLKLDISKMPVLLQCGNVFKVYIFFQQT